MTDPEYRARRDRLAGILAGRKLDALLVSALPNIRYLSGFTGSNGLLLTTPDEAILLTDPRYEFQAPAQTTCTVRICKASLVRAAGAVIHRKRLKQIGFESTLSYSVYDLLREQLALGAELAPTTGLVEELRAVKSPAEIELVRLSVDVCSGAFRRAVRRIRPGIREVELAAEIDHQMRKLGAEKPAFETIVASGPRSALPHAEPVDKVFKANELLLVDMGARRQGYSSDMTRMVHLGRPAPRIRRLHAAVLEAQLAALDAIRENVAASAVDRKARQVLRSHGLDNHFTHSTGHGLGLEIHESPKLGKGEKTRLKPGMVITVEPGVYIKGFGGIRIEDTVVVTRNGCEVLTAVRKELLVI